ncbi:MAG TPA: hypothetical protein DHW15_06005 [Bacteroidetes bacterium]|jgi:histidinol dehydrogenase|nr:MAG: hypothetical protein ABR94_05060 [Sphingobacteriales bacterium BACL12 MAG-120802-bin5]KRP13443.1 MAG: hypothetical protein ABR95_13900 [Sphingobacteriales bacterium BACL12 MAG-120813-bin55]HCK21715.1 hypothetical protein [Bacteroidota bacterium]
MKKLIILWVMVMLTWSVNAQPHKEDDRTAALRIAFLTKYLELTPAESEKFWPVYNEMRAAGKAEMDKFKERLDKKDPATMSDAELEQLLNAQLENEQAMLNIKKAYLQKFKTVLPLQKVWQLSTAEEAFRRELLQHVRDRRDGPGAPPPGERRGPSEDLRYQH